MEKLARGTMAFLLFCGVLAGCDTAESETQPEDDGRAEVQAELEGQWITACSKVPDSDPPAFAVYDVVNEGETGTFRYGMYADDKCTTQLVDFVIESKQEISTARPDIGEGVHELNIYYNRLTATPYVEGYVQALQGAGCGTGPYAVGETIDTSDTGCFLFKPMSECDADYDIMKIEGTRYWNGVRTPNMCVPEGRPTELNQFWFDRAE